MPEAARRHRKQKQIIFSACVPNNQATCGDVSSGSEGQEQPDLASTVASDERRSGAPGSTPGWSPAARPAWLRKWSARLQVEGESLGRSKSDSEVLQIAQKSEVWRSKSDSEVFASRPASEPASERVNTELAGASVTAGDAGLASVGKPLQNLLHAGLHRKKKLQSSLCMEALAEGLEECDGDGAVSCAELSTCDEHHGILVTTDEGTSHASALDSDLAPLTEEAEAPAWSPIEGAFVSGHALMPGLRWARPEMTRSRPKAAQDKKESRSGAKHKGVRRGQARWA